MFSSQKVFGSRLLEMSAMNIGRFCSGSSLNKSVVNQCQKLSKLKNQLSDLSYTSVPQKDESSQNLLDASENDSDLMKEMKEIADMLFARSALSSKLSLSLTSLMGVGSRSHRALVGLVIV